MASSLLGEWAVPGLPKSGSGEKWARPWGNGRHPRLAALPAWLYLAGSSSGAQRCLISEQPQPMAQWRTPGSMVPALPPLLHQGIAETYRMRISFHSSSELPICFPVFLVSLGSPSPATST